MGVYINIDVKEIRHGAVAVLNIDDVAFFVATKDIIAVPDHGDLVDRDALAKELGINDFDCDKCGWHKEKPYPYCSAELDDACFSLENAEVIIPAERTADLCDACGKVDKENCSYCEKMERSEE